MNFEEYSAHDGIALARLVTEKKVKASELVDLAIARAKQVNPKLNAIVFEDYERARATASGKASSGIFGGVPFLLKDILAYAEGMPTRQACAFFPETKSDHDSLITARFKSAGLIPLGKTNVPELGLVPTTESRLYGPARNPWDVSRSTGGSSGGSAAAVAAGVVPLAHANDGGGSIRIPASCCGLVGLKPSRGRISFAPDFAEVVDGLATDLVVSRSVRDSAAALDAVAGSVSGDPYASPPAPASYLEAIEREPGKLRIAFATDKLDKTALHPDCIAAVERCASLCERLGHTVEQASPNLDQSQLIPAFMALWGGNLAAGIDALALVTGARVTEDKFEGLTWGLYQAGKSVSASDYLIAKMAMNSASREAARFHQTYDVWISATLGLPPVPLGTFDMEERDPVKAFAPLIDYVPFTAMQNVTGQPAINIPLHWNAQGLPIGVQLVSRFGDEETLLRLAAQLEKASPWAKNYSRIRI
ncbi:MAG: amidase [Alphaproteobacteria bacterium]|nr:amidase [Alphaproteobacteria bacterium]